MVISKGVPVTDCLKKLAMSLLSGKFSSSMICPDLANVLILALILSTVSLPSSIISFTLPLKSANKVFIKLVSMYSVDTADIRSDNKRMRRMVFIWKRNFGKQLEIGSNLRCRHRGQKVKGHLPTNCCIWNHSSNIPTASYFS